MTATPSPWRATVLTLFPEMFPGPLGISLAGRALASGLWALEARDIRASATDRHRSVDDTPFGGGAGMVMRPDPLFASVEAVGPPRPLYLLGPGGRRFDQTLAHELAGGSGFSLLCGRYEGIDQRVHDHLVDDELSVGDVVLSGGEVAACLVIEAVVRLLPGAPTVMIQLGQRRLGQLSGLPGNLVGIIAGQLTGTIGKSTQQRLH